MATAAQHEDRYIALRSAILARHFAAGEYQRVNYYADGESPLADPTDPWSMTDVIRENPLLSGANLLIAMAVEHTLGNPGALPVLRLAVDSLGALYTATDSFAGYPIRWDPVASDLWDVDAAGNPLRTRRFLTDADGNYLTSGVPTTDPRAVPWRSWETLTALLTPEQFAGYRGRFWEHVSLHRRWEPSTDEIVGLVASYAVVHDLVDDPVLRQAIEDQVGPLQQWLADGAFLLLRPVGGISARGGLGFAASAEYAYRLAFERILGAAGPPSATLEAALDRAGLWPVLAGPVTRIEVAGVAGTVLAAGVGPAVLAAVAATFVTALGPLGGLLLGTVGAVVGTVPAAFAAKPVVAAALGQVDLVEIWRAVALFLHRDCVDVIHYHKEEDQSGTWISGGQAGELAIAAGLLSISPELRLAVTFATLPYLGKGMPPQGFGPYLVLASGMDPGVVGAYDAWFRSWLAASPPPTTWTGPPPTAANPDSVVACAVALLAAPAPDLEAELLRRLDALFDWISTADGGALMRGDLPDERVDYAIDYLGGLALAWRYAQLAGAAGTPVATTGFPVPPATWTAVSATVPATVLAGSARLRTALGTDGLQVPPGGLDVFAAGVQTTRAAPPPMAVPVRGGLLWEGVALLPRSHATDVPTGLWLQDGDEWELQLSSSTGRGVGADGTGSLIEDARFPLHVGLDPMGAVDRVALVRLGGWVRLGAGRVREPFDYPHDAVPMYLRLNAIRPRGRGRFVFTARIWGIRPADAPGTEVSCVTRLPILSPVSGRVIRRTVRIGGVGPDGTPWHVMVADAAALIEQQGHVFSLPGPPPRPLDVARVSTAAGPVTYLRARGDISRANQLDLVPDCPHAFP